MIRIDVKGVSVSEAALGKTSASLAQGGLDRPVELAAFKTQVEIVKAMPSRTGITRRRWTVLKNGTGSRLVVNDSKVMKFLEEGTGQTTGGYIYPKSKKFLYIPLRHGATVWRPGLKFGKDFVLARRVRGIKALHLVRNFIPKAKEILRTEMRRYLEKIIK